MTKTIDLHGLSVEAATSKIILALDEARSNQLTLLTIITGYGSGTLRTITIDLIEQENLDYIEEGPSVIVYLLNDSNLDTDNDFFDEYNKKFQ
ncbi:Smr/MutS family protein [Mycoplasmopsis caviae]|uniref:Smr domain n=1 Tax=Mycoplasmopsis caviae TaxID=55603 RepID=A0A3P8L7V8_9BACT|nr:Smr/MutS family protein [Mycoplasmopsis caviae]UUD35738.1 Smr/MutS family protein [Mycoplasmopsis caviae]VDR42385.1 Smr domain [Mycoplasmopsis caviae]